MNLKDVVRICGYVIGFGSLLTGQVVSAIISPYGASQNTTTHVLAIVGSFVTLATLVKSVLDKPADPTGLHAVYSTDVAPTPATLTTAPEAAQKATP